jgi:hypothetical protein
MAYAATRTLLPLDIYARLLGISPLAFNGGDATECTVTVAGGCADIWLQQPWQNHAIVSIEELARTIRDAEEDVARYLGTWPGPEWVAEEYHEWPAHWRPGMPRQWKNVRGEAIVFDLAWKKIRKVGRRAVTLLGTATAGVELVFSDEDGDTYKETATVTLTVASLPDTDSVAVYFPGEGGARGKRIPLTSISYVGTTLSITLNSWMLVLPSLREGLNHAGTAIDLCDEDNLLASVEVYREHVAVDAAPAQLVWQPLDGESAETVQDALVQVLDPDAGLVSVAPATGDGAGTWTVASSTRGDAPSGVRIWYQAGCSEDNENFGVCRSFREPLFKIVSARLKRPVSTCMHITEQVQYLQRDITYRSENDGAWAKADTMREAPFGTRLGEAEAYTRLRMLKRQLWSGLSAVGAG